MNFGSGTIFSFNPTGNVLTSLASFDGTNGIFPVASLTLGTDGLFYGTTDSGGSFGVGRIFSFDTNFSTNDQSTPVPEPSALLGTTIAVALGATLKRKSAHKPKK
ncbi:PEP-CTERM sorting domain-containing protein [Microcystis aeruginosa CS-564/01]|uniref:PEP-CTERM sorting domain-containing protein n=1 Tax=Microcystis aeruginosa TaxID=1126 RepID=UPI00232C7A1A|nr:PEP-CTERM sorting domain-containing protein [Microcystis aeruginosa]MDB9423616.1 PEP-CTERM sorting domain-containing protein [Microcystis aeruginosa CS-564/01]